MIGKWVALSVIMETARYIKIYVFIIFYHERFHINCNVFVTIQYTSENLVYNRLLCIF